MNAELVEYGINEEESDIRAHVSILGKQVIVFKTQEVRGLISEHKYRTSQATQPGVNGLITAEGLLVPISDITGRYVLRSADCPWPDNEAYQNMTLVQKGDWAVKVVRASIVHNKFPLWVAGVEVIDKEIDIRGMDIIISARRRIQVKHDWGAYDRKHGGTGNVFIQTKECNPRRLYGNAGLDLQQAEFF